MQSAVATIVLYYDKDRWQNSPDMLDMTVAISATYDVADKNSADVFIEFCEC